jgi:AcrR family transcriptional regulator
MSHDHQTSTTREPTAVAVSRPKPGRRARKKEATRLSILAAALELFAGQGYARTTIAQIASAADVSEATVYVHFNGGKESILAHPIEDRARVLADMLNSRPRGTSTLDTFFAYLHQAQDSSDPLSHDLEIVRQVALAQPMLFGSLADRWTRIVATPLANSFSQDYSEVTAGFCVEQMTAMTLAVASDFGRFLAVTLTPTTDRALWERRCSEYLAQASAALRAAWTTFSSSPQPHS